MITVLLMSGCTEVKTSDAAAAPADMLLDDDAGEREAGWIDAHGLRTQVAVNETREEGTDATSRRQTDVHT